MFSWGLIHYYLILENGVEVEAIEESGNRGYV